MVVGLPVVGHLAREHQHAGCALDGITIHPEYRVQVLDARPRHHISRTVDLMQGAIWRDPDRVDEWIGELSTDEPVAVYCAYGFHVGCSVTRTLRERGFDARFIRGGVSAWYAAGGARSLRT